MCCILCSQPSLYPTASCGHKDAPQHLSHAWHVLSVLLEVVIPLTGRKFSGAQILFNFLLTPRTYGVQRVFSGGWVGEGGGRGISDGADRVFITSLAGKPFARKTSTILAPWILGCRCCVPNHWSAEVHEGLGTQHLHCIYWMGMPLT